MTVDDPIGIIALGNINIKCLIFKVKNDNKAEILSTSITQSEGIHNDVVINLTKASNVIRKCISIAEKKAKPKKTAAKKSASPTTEENKTAMEKSKLKKSTEIKKKKD